MKKMVLCAAIAFCAFAAFGQQIVVAIAPFEALSGAAEGDAEIIAELLSIRLAASGAVKVVSRAAQEQIMREHRFQLGDWSSDSKTAQFGAALNADWVIRGRVQKLSGGAIIVTAAPLDVKTHQVMGGADMRLADTDEAYGKMDGFVQTMVRTMSGARPAGNTSNPLLGAWEGKSAWSRHAILEFNDDGTFILAGFVRSHFNVTRAGNGSISTRTSILGTASGTYTYNRGTLSLEYTISGSRTVERDGTIVERNDNYTEKGRCTVTYSIALYASDGYLKVGRAPLFEAQRNTGNANSSNFTDYFEVFRKQE